MIGIQMAGISISQPVEDDAGTLLELIGEVHGLLDLAEFRTGLLDALARALPSHSISIHDRGAGPASSSLIVEPELTPEARALWARLAHESPLVARYERTRDGRACRLSDIAATGELDGPTVCRDLYGPLGLPYQLAFMLPHDPAHLLTVALGRRTHDYSEGERDLVNRAHPFLVQAYRNAVEHSQLHAELARRTRPLPANDLLIDALAARGLTDREAEVIGWIAMGRSNRGAADELAVSERTVQKHLQRCYRKLGVHSRSEAATLVWSLSRMTREE